MSDGHATRDAWDAFGGGYDRAFSSSFTAIARAALRFADVQPGMRLLDVAAGSGALSIPAAELGAEVLATDLSPGMLDLLRARAAEAGVTSIRCAVMDGMELDLEDGTFERVCSQFGVMLFPDTDAGLREMVRVTAPGGLGVVVIFGRPEHVMPLWLCEQALHAALPDAELPPGNRLQTDPMSLTEAMSAAGFADVGLEKLEMSVEVGSPLGAWDVMSAAMAMLLSKLPDDQVGAVRDRFVDAVLERYGPKVTNLPVEIIVGVGSKL
jgi:ubiquinone/menaquinone biosynthesis C-methylase UbiE